MEQGHGAGSAGLPDWVPAAAQTYLEHVERGAPIRALARRAEVHPSTILRQVRRWEARRDDPLVDAALRRLSSSVREGRETPARAPSDDRLREVLSGLARPHMVLAVARDMETAILVEDLGNGASERVGALPRALAEHLALRDWIRSADAEARVARYRITPAGRAALQEVVARCENRATGLAEAREAFSSRARPRSPLPDSPLVQLRRRRDKRGRTFLGRAHVRAGERLHEDFALAGVPLMDRAELAAFLDAPAPSDRAARALWMALTALGPDMAELALRCCCHMEGLEPTEKRLGWSARSGKIVLRIALSLLDRHYASQGEAAQMVG